MSPLKLCMRLLMMLQQQPEALVRVDLHLNTILSFLHHQNFHMDGRRLMTHSMAHTTLSKCYRYGYICFLCLLKYRLYLQRFSCLSQSRKSENAVRKSGSRGQEETRFRHCSCNTDPTEGSTSSRYKRTPPCLNFDWIYESKRNSKDTQHVRISRQQPRDKHTGSSLCEWLCMWGEEDRKIRLKNSESSAILNMMN